MPPRYTSVRFVGREDAFARLASVLQSAAVGDAGALLIDGTAGVGVTRFIDEAVRRVGTLQEPTLVLRGCASPDGADRPYGPVLQALGPMLAALRDDELARVMGTATDELMALLPGLADRIDPAWIPGRRWLTTGPERRQARVLEGVLGVVGRLSERRPTLFVIEDLHRADAATRRLLGFLARIARSQRLSIVGTYQGDAMRRTDPWAMELQELERAPRPPERLTLPPLGRDDLARLVEAIEGQRPSASVLVLVVERSAGRPLVAEELLAARRELPGVSLASTFEDLVLARVAIRSPECRRVLRLMAPAGRDLSRLELVAIADAYERDATSAPPRSSSGPRLGDGVLDADLAAGLDEAIEHGFVTDANGALCVRHELVSRAIEADLLPTSSIRHQVAIARALGDDPFVATRHHLLAHDPIAAGVAAVGAADAAAAVHAPADELRALELAIGIEGAVAGRSSRSAAARQRRAAVGSPAKVEWGPAGLAIRAAEAAFAAGRPVRAAAYVEAILGATDGRRDRTARGLLHARLADFLRASGDAERALAARRRAVALVPNTLSVARATVVAGLAQARMLDGTFSEAERLAAEAIRIARACDPPDRHWELHATTTHGVSLGWRGDPEQAIATLREARAMAESLGDFDELFRIFANLTTVLDLAGRREEAVSVASEGIEEARDAGLEAVYGNVLRGNAADSLFLLGRWQEARSLSTTALEWLPVGVHFLNTLVALATVEIESSAGEVAGRLLGRTMLELEALPDAQQAVPLHLAAASFALWRGDVADALRSADRGWSLARETEDWILAARAAATAVEADAAAAIEAREKRDLATLAAARERSHETIRSARVLLRRHGVDGALGSRRLADAYLATARAHRGRVDGRDPGASWDAVAMAWRDLGIPYELARARWREAEARLGAGAGRYGRADARAPLLEAVDIALKLGAMPLLRELRDLAGRSRINLPPEVADRLGNPDDRPGVMVGPGRTPATTASLDTPDGAVATGLIRQAVATRDTEVRQDTFGLSRREHDVLVHLTKGRTNREIGERLFISQKTVGVHVGNILSKLGVSGRVEAAAVAIRLGLIEPG